MELSETIAANVKRIREQRKLTLDAAAEITGVSRSMLAQIEKGDVNPTISVIGKIAGGFKIPFTSLIEKAGEDVTLIRGGHIKPLIEDDGRYLNYPTFSFDEKKLFECYRIVIEPGGSLTANPHLKGTQEYFTVFSGEIELSLDAGSYRLSAGDSIRFRADVNHGYKNLSGVRAELSMLIYYNDAP